MASLKQLKDKQASVKSIHKITSAMELVSTAKSRNATKDLAAYKDFYQKVEDIVKQLTSSKDYIVPEEFEGTLYVVFSSDMGLAGGYPSNVIKLLMSEFDQNKDKLIVFGNKADASIKSRFNDKLEYKHYGVNDIKQPDILNEVTADILEANIDKNMKVDVIYTKYVSQIEFEATKVQLLPIEKTEDEEGEKANGPQAIVEFEPDAPTVLKEMMDIYVPSVLTGYYKEAVASEHSARRVAMENATNNGEDLLSDLQIQFNKQRQAKITQELSEISAGSEALK